MRRLLALRIRLPTGEQRISEWGPRDDGVAYSQRGPLGVDPAKRESFDRGFNSGIPQPRDQPLTRIMVGLRSCPVPPLTVVLSNDVAAAFWQCAHLTSLAGARVREWQ